MSQRVSDERLAEYLRTTRGLYANERYGMAEDLRDSRAECATLKEQLEAARAQIQSQYMGRQTERAARKLAEEQLAAARAANSELARQMTEHAHWTEGERALREKAEAALLDCQRYVLDNDIDFARAKITSRVAEVLRAASLTPEPPK